MNSNCAIKQSQDIYKSNAFQGVNLAKLNNKKK